MSTDATSAKVHAAYIEDLLDMVDFLAQRPELTAELGGAMLCAWTYGDKEKFERVFRSLGRCTKTRDGGYFRARRDFGPHDITITASQHAVCEQVTVMREVTEWVCPDSPLSTDEEEVGSD